MGAEVERLSDYTHRLIRGPSESEGRIFGKTMAVFGAAAGEGVDDPRRYAERHAGGADGSEVADSVEAAMRRTGAIGGLEHDPGFAPVLTSVALGVFNALVLGRIPGARRLGFVSPVGMAQILGAGASWRRDGKAIRVAPVSFARVALHRRSVAAIVVVSREFATLAVNDDTAAETLSAVARDAVRRELDSVFCGTAAAVTNTQPAGIGYAAQTVASSGATASAIAADVRSMVAKMVGGDVSIRSAVWIVSAEAYSLLASLKVLDANGTTLAGRPVVSDAPSGTFLLVATDFLGYATDDQIAIARSTSGTIELDSAPTGDLATPTAASASMVSLFQADAVAVRASLNVDWTLVGPDDSDGQYAAVRLTGASYA
jgi:hypothetical protein